MFERGEIMGHTFQTDSFEHTTYYRYLKSHEAELFTVVCLPKENGVFPTVIQRNPYVDCHEHLKEDEICEHICNASNSYLANGYAVVFQHCRGRGKSSGDCIPYI